MEKVADWQIGALGTSQAKTWIEATFYIGLMATYRTTQQPRFLQHAKSWAKANQWTLGPREGNADDQCAGQTYLELYAIDRQPNEITPTCMQLDKMITVSQPGFGFKIWWWADALFMAPPAFARMGNITSNTKYFDAMSTMWWDTTQNLYDASSSLFFRDANYVQKTCPNGEKMFWSRGNGWVLAGLARVLEYLPQSHSDRSKFISLFTAMSKKLAMLQKPDGFWASCLTDAIDYPLPESSGTAAFIYGLAWGVNHGLLDSATFLPVIQKGWCALESAVDANGKLGWVQKVGKAPGPSNQGDTAPYGVGLFLLAGSEVLPLGGCTAQ
ncbi:hypothetical protein BGZ96_002430 [Linnemannia gamsii]|uniref:Glycoside hydrolase family 88 protein n=1 Tax=Linnemannia gamsii TaxID=64522 RepID=A0ABQ7K9X6_9FUNG|nr:hypothetical protein BGZ96_002430 [Linnemannia gamsii]